MIKHNVSSVNIKYFDQPRRDLRLVDVIGLREDFGIKSNKHNFIYKELKNDAL